jgi:hypothetical protein
MDLDPDLISGYEPVPPPAHAGTDLAASMVRRRLLLIILAVLSVVLMAAALGFVAMKSFGLPR